MSIYDKPLVDYGAEFVPGLRRRLTAQWRIYLPIKTPN